MANVMEILGRIKTAIYGRDVRQSIYDAILQCYMDATGNPESIAAHTGDTNNPHNVTADQVGLGTAAEDISQAKKDISGLKNPEFEDFTADGSTPPDARAAIAAITSKMSFFTYLSKVKAALMGLVTLGEMRSLLINNGLTTEAGKYFLDAAYGKTLADLVASNASAITQLNSEKTNGIYVVTNYQDKTLFYEFFTEQKGKFSGNGLVLFSGNKVFTDLESVINNQLNWYFGFLISQPDTGRGFIFCENSIYYVTSTRTSSTITKIY